MRRHTLGYKFITYVLVLANVLFALPARASWHCITGESCPVSCSMVPNRAPMATKTTRIPCRMPCCSRAIMGTCPMQMSQPQSVSRRGIAAQACGSSRCILRVPRTAAANLPSWVQFACTPPLVYTFSLPVETAASLHHTSFLLAVISCRTLRPPPSRAPPGQYN